MFGFNLKDRWYKVLSKKYLKGKLDSPYDNLFDYYNLLINRPYKKPSSIASHFYLFFLAKERDELSQLDSDLYAILPENLYENFSDAMEEFNHLTEGIDIDDLEYEEEKELVQAFKIYDDYANQNYKVMEDILRDCLNKLK